MTNTEKEKETKERESEREEQSSELEETGSESAAKMCKRAGEIKRERKKER